MILILGLNPVWQKVLTFDDFEKGQVNRAGSLVSFASGKGINMVRALNQLKISSHIVQPIGGVSGNQFLDDASDFANLSTTSISAYTRICTTCLDGKGGATEIIEPSPSLFLAENEALLELISSQMAQVDSVIVAGTIPEGVDLKALALILKGQNVMLDNVQQAEALLEYGVGSSLKINVKELQQLVGGSGIIGIQSLINRYPQLENIAITNEAEATFLYTHSKFYKLEIEGNWPVLNPIGAGDTATAIWTHNLQQEITGLSAFVKAQAAARASCLTKIPGEFLPSEASRITKNISITEL